MTTDDRSAAEWVAHASAVLLDFDGPICRLFAEVQSADVAADLRRYLQQRGAPVPDDGTGDPLAVLRMSAGAGADILAGVHTELARAELGAARSAVPTADADIVIRELAERGQKLGIVSNNAGEAVHEYLTMHNLDVYITAVSARASSDPLLMKPNPHLLGKALSDLHVSAADAIFVGDSATDVEACIALGLGCIGYANKIGKTEQLRNAGAIGVVGAMSALL